MVHRRLSLVLCCLALLWSAPVARAGAADVPCSQVRIPVSLVAGGPATSGVAATYCLPARWGAGRRAVDVYVPGATYNRSYWDWPTSRSTYSFVLRSARAGRAALAIDRLGTGASSRPPSALLNLTVDAYVLHQVIGRLRADGRVGSVNLIGHSLGSGIAVVEAATYHDVDRLVTTGLLHSLGSGLTSTLGSFRPAASDPVLGGRGYDLGYLTTAPGTRKAAFYAASADPAVIAYDEQHKDVVAATEMAGYPTLLAPPILNVARRIDVPVLEVAGQQDVLLCGGSLNCADAAAVQAHEVPYFPAARSVSTLTVPSTGHDLALHPSAASTFDAINTWILTH